MQGALFDRRLTENVVWAPHNLGQDSSFNTFHVILCRNVMIYFDRTLQHQCTGCSSRASSASALALGHKGVDPLQRLRGAVRRARPG
jgi:chemotaxis protein methyltransferase CheR